MWHPVPKKLLLVSLLVGIPGILAGMLFQIGGEQFHMAWVAAPAFFGFGLFKAAWGLNAQSMLGDAGEEAQRLIASHGSEAEVRAWIKYKLLAAIIAVCASVLCLGFIVYGVLGP